MRACLALVAACGSTPPTTHEAPDPPSRRVVQGPLTPTPHVGYKDGHYAFDLLPAIAKHSEVIVLAIEDEQGGRDAQNLRLEVRDRQDKLIQTIPVETPDEGSAQHDRSALPAAVQKRLDDANHELAKLHGVHELEALHPLAVEDAHDGEDKHWATGDNLDVEWREHHLRVFRHNIRKPLVDADGTSWLAKPHDAGDAPCENPAYLRDAYHAATNNVVVVAIGYRGNDRCWQPPVTYHVITWY
jgi:hypothetical protein